MIMLYQLAVASWAWARGPGSYAYCMRLTAADEGRKVTQSVIIPL
jgi:hypothetical protein